MNHHAVLIKLVTRQVPINLLEMSLTYLVDALNGALTFLISSCPSLSPSLLCLYIDNIVTMLKSLGHDCNALLTCTNIFLYADDIMLILPSVSMLQTMLQLCESEILDLDMSIKVNKSVCMRVFPRLNATCANLTTIGDVGGDLLA